MEGIIYKVQAYKEHARLLFVYTPKGKITLQAQGAQKINHEQRILAQFLTHISFKEQPKSFYTLAEGKIINDFSEIKEDYVQTQSAALILEILDHFVVDDFVHEALFHEVILALSQKDIRKSSLSFILKMLKPLGYEIQMHADGRKVIGLNIETGMMIYEGSSDIIDLDVKDSIYILKYLKMPYQDLEDIPEDVYRRIKHFVLKYYQYHLQTTLKNLQ